MLKPNQASFCTVLPATLQFLVAMITCAINDRKQRQVAYCLEEVRVLKEALKDLTGSTRIAFTAEQRRRLAIKGKDLSHKERKECCQIVRPETILAWFRQLAARKYDSSKSKNRTKGRPRKTRNIHDLVVRLAQENPGWGYTKIRDALRTGLKIEIGRTTVANILCEAGLAPAPERLKNRTWKQFLKIHFETLYACKIH